MVQKKKTMKKWMLLFACIGAVFLALALLLFVSDGNIVKFPRNDLAPAGFVIMGVIYLIGAAAAFVTAQDRDALICENDERLQSIEAKSAMTAFGVQTMLLATCIFLLIFLGYLNAVAAFSMIGVLAAGIIVYAAAQIYYRKKM